VGENHQGNELLSARLEAETQAVVLRAEVACGLALPAIVRRTGERGERRFVEFFTATIRNQNTREA
jgi:hypothetical protein